MMRLFKRKTNAQPEPTVITPARTTMMDPMHFDKWFKELYTGYAPAPTYGKGIWLRTDKLSEAMIIDYFNWYQFLWNYGDVWLLKDAIVKHWLSIKNA
jgi:hypothetical protein